MKPANRPLEGQALTGILKELAKITALSDGLKYSMEPISPEDKECGAEPLTLAQMKEPLEEIGLIVTDIVLQKLHAKPEEWYEANDSIE